jgi:non-specific serine/threonine protein kinase
MLPKEWIERFRRVFAVGQARETAHRFSLHHVSLVNDLLDRAEIRHADAHFTALRQKIASFESITHRDLPSSLKAELRQYQHGGYDWLLFLKEFGFSGCLADDMGLGKTVQTLALLLHEYGNGATLPTLIVVPTSLIFNWINEARKFAPSLRFMSYTGTQRRQSKQHVDNIDVVLTTYGTLRRDIEIFANMEFHYAILDESQNIKNARSQTARAVRRLKSTYRLVLTGTPVENNLMELWSQFAFLQPGFLGTESEFREQFAIPIEKEQNSEAAQVLKAMTFPFMLRRTKELVATELPPKVESITYCEMDKPQELLYHSVRDGYRSSIMQSIEKDGLNKSRLKVLEGLMKLREICCHPVLIEEQYNGSSGKFDVWKGMLEEILAEGHKVLVFSQFVKMLRVLSSHCDTIGIDYEYLDGQTRDREERVRRFQEDGSVKLFLISLKAGGTGLNLTSADYVIHYDPWWNPAVEEQATDRTHRIGQMNNVFSYKLITRDSVEEKILQLQEKKRALVESVITSDTGFLKSLSKKDIESLFS